MTGGFSAALVVLTVLAHPARAQLIPGIDEWAAAVSENMGAEELRTKVSAPEVASRPSTLGAVGTLFSPAAVHFSAAAHERLATRAFAALEDARERLHRAGWPEPLTDGGLGGTAGFDLYLVDSGLHAVDAQADGPIFWSEWDSVSTFGVVNVALVGNRFDACVFSAYAQAVLLAMDPAEASAWRRATAEWLARSLGGFAGCTDGVETQQREPWRSWISGAAEDGDGGALYLGMISDRHDAGSGIFLREVWQLARQHCDSVVDLSGRPDLWEALASALTTANDDLRGLVEELAVARWFSGKPSAAQFAPFPFLARVGPGGVVPTFDVIRASELPEHTRAIDPPLESFGSAYVLVEGLQGMRGGQLRLWLEGEYGVLWSFVAVRLAADGHEIARLRAPQKRDGHAYLVLELLEDTSAVLLVVTNLSSRLPDADVPDENVRSAKIVVGT